MTTSSSLPPQRHDGDIVVVMTKPVGHLACGRPGWCFQLRSKIRPAESSTWRSMTWCGHVVWQPCHMSKYGILTHCNPVRHWCETCAWENCGFPNKIMSPDSKHPPLSLQVKGFDGSYVTNKGVPHEIPEWLLSLKCSKWVPSAIFHSPSKWFWLKILHFTDNVRIQPNFSYNWCKRPQCWVLWAECEVRRVPTTWGEWCSTSVSCATQTWRHSRRSVSQNNSCKHLRHSAADTAACKYTVHM